MKTNTPKIQTATCARPNHEGTATAAWRKASRRILAGSIAALLSVQAAYASSDSWTGVGDAMWSNSANWLTTPGVVPGTGDTATFNAAVGVGGATIDLGGGVTVNTVIFDNTSTTLAAYTIGAGGVNNQTLMLDNAGALTMNANVATDELFNAAVVLGNDGSTQSFTLSNASTTNGLQVAGTITGSAGIGTKTLTVAGAGNTSLSGVIGDGAGGGNVALTKSGGGTLTLTVANSFTGGLTIKAGTVTGSNASSFGAGAGVITIGDSTGSVNATLSGGLAGTFANPISVASGNTGVATIIDTAASIFSGAITLNSHALNLSTVSSTLTSSGGVTGTGNLVLNATGAGVITLSTADVNNTGTITNSGIGTAVDVITANIGSNVTGVIQNSTTSALTLSGTNTYTGPTTVSAGTLKFNTAAAIGGTARSVTVASGATVAGGYAIDNAFLNRLAENSNAFAVAIGAADSNNLDFSSSTGANLPNASLGATSAFTYSGTLTPNSAVYRLGGGGATLTVSSTLAAGNALAVSGSPVTLTAANLLDGATTISGTTLTLNGTAGALAATSGITLANGGSLLLTNATATNNTNRINDSAAITVNGGGTLNFGVTTTANAGNFSETVGAVMVNSGNFTYITQSTGNTLIPTQSNTFTFGGLVLNNSATAFITDPHNSVNANWRVLITGQADTAGDWLGPNILMNGGYATYDTTKGVLFDWQGTTQGVRATKLLTLSGSTPTSAPTLGVTTPSTNGTNNLNSATLYQWRSLLITSNGGAGTDTLNLNGSTLKLVGGGLAFHSGNDIINNGTITSGSTSSVPLYIGGTGVNGSNLKITATLVDNPGGGAMPVIVFGSGSLNLAGANTYTGDTLINDSSITLILTNPLALQNSTLNYQSYQGAGGSIQFGTVSSSLTAATFGGLKGDKSLLLKNASANPVALSVGNNNQSTTYSGVLSGTGSLTKIGTGTLTLSGANIHTGATTINAGTLDLGGGTATGSLVSSVLNLGGGTLSYTRTGSQTQNFTTTNLNAGPASAVSVVSGDILNLGTIVNNGGTINFGSTGAGTVGADTASNTSGIISGATFNGTTWAVANGAGTAITGLAAYTTTSGAGTTAANYASNNIDVNNSAGLVSNVITANSLRFNTSAATTVTLAAGTNALGSSSLLVTSTVGNFLSTITGGDLTGAANKTLIIVQNNGSNGLTISSNIVDNGTSGLSKFGAGTLTLRGVNTYSGGTTISVGTLTVGGAGQLGSGSYAGAISNAGTFNYNSSAAQTLSGVISGAGVLTQSGAGTQVLTGANTYTGATSINAGRLEITNTNASSITTGGGTLGGSGGSTTGSVTVNSGGIDAGTGTGTAGTLTMAGLTFTGGSLTADLVGTGTGNYDQLRVNGTVALGLGVATLMPVTGLTAAMVAGQIFYLVDNTTGSGTTGFFAGLTEGTTFMLNSQTYKITYQANAEGNSFTGGNDVAIEYIYPYSQYVTDHAGLGAANASTANDGILNLLKYALGVSTPLAYSGQFITYSLSGGNENQITFTRPQTGATNYPSDITSYQVQATSDLITWTNLTTPAVGAGAGTETITVTDTGFPTTGTPRFIRLVVTN